MKKIVCLDLDDTLIQTQESYEKVNERLVYLLQSKASISKEKILEILYEIDIEQIKTKGLSKDRFPNSWVETFKYFLGNQIFSEEAIYKEAANIFIEKIDLHSDAKHFLEKISQINQFNVWIVTHGDYEVQTKRIHDINLQWVDDVVISEHKDLALYQHLKSKTQGEIIMIGNSIRHDILPAIEAGLTGIHIKREKEWKYDSIHSHYEFPSFETLDYVWSHLFKGEETCQL